MTNEEFQKIVLEELKIVRGEIKAVKGELTGEIQAVRGELKEEIQAVKGELKTVGEEIKTLRQDIGRIDNTLKAVYNQTAVLTEFRTETNKKLDNIMEDNKSIHEILGEHEVSIRTIKRRPV